MEKISAFRRQLETHRPADWETLPDFPLYMDQVLSYMERQTIRLDESDALTASMVNRITFYLSADDDGFAQLGRLRTALQGFKDAHAGKYGTLLMTMENLKDADWENNWKQYYKPMEIGERLLVIPEWEQENVKGQAKYAGKVPLILEPGLTFGTGSHATTRLCLTALEKKPFTAARPYWIWAVAAGTWYSSENTCSTRRGGPCGEIPPGSAEFFPPGRRAAPPRPLKSRTDTGAPAPGPR